MPDAGRLPLILGNWKMNTSLEEAIQLAAGVSSIAEAHPSVEVGILPPAIWLVPLHRDRDGSSRLRIGAQDVSQHADGAFTGELSVAMLSPWCDYILVGHSERRQYHQETDRVVSAKLDAVFKSACIPVLAVGESKDERESGMAQAVVERQLEGTLTGRTAEELSRIAIAYEPVWAIGTGKSASGADAQEMAAIIRRWLFSRDQQASERIRILYGGSMKPSNAAEILANPDVDGGLIGGASLVADDFGKIVEAAHP